MVGNVYYVTKYKLEYLMNDNTLHPYATLEDSKRGNVHTVSQYAICYLKIFSCIMVVLIFWKFFTT